MAMQAQADLTKENAIEFGVRDEPWIKYRLEDGTPLFGRLVIPKIFKADEYDPSGQHLRLVKPEHVHNHRSQDIEERADKSSADNTRPEQRQYDTC